MIVVMEKSATEDQIEHMVLRVEDLGLKAHVIRGAERTVIAAIGDKREHMKESLASGSGVSDVVPIMAPYKVASREVKPEPTQVQVGSLADGGGAYAARGRDVERGDKQLRLARGSAIPALHPGHRRGRPPVHTASRDSRKKV